MQFPPLPFGLDKYLALKIAKTRYCVELDNNNEKAQTMTSVGTKGTTTASSSAADLVGCNGEGLFGKQNPKWYPCDVKKDNQDGTIKVQWDEGKKFTARLPAENFRLTEEPVDVGAPKCIDIFGVSGDDADY